MSERLPFDPSRIRRPEPSAGVPTAPAILTVRQLNEVIHGIVAQHTPPTVHVLGEISNISRPSSAHLYFSLKDHASELRCVMWRSAAARLKFEPEDGLEVIATGGVEVYTPRGTYQLIVRRLEPRGVGALEIAFRQLRERLAREGLFDPGRKRPLPRIPARIGLVTSPTGAAIRDILQTLERRFPAVEVILYPVRVQGEGAADEIAAAIRGLDRWSAELGGVDVLIVGRGGGSLEDLWAFNEEVVARAIADCRIPVVSAVGHEVDVSIADLVADVRAPTPTGAAELVSPSLPALHEWFAQRVARAARAARHRLDVSLATLRSLTAREPLARPHARLNACVQLVDEAQSCLQVLFVQQRAGARARLTAAEVRLLRLGTGARTAQLRHRLETRVQHLRHAWGRFRDGLAWDITGRITRLRAYAPPRRIADGRSSLAQLLGRLRRAATALLRQQRRLLDARVVGVQAYDPRQVLRRGYSLTRDAHTQRIVRSVLSIRDRQRLLIELSDGTFHATAEDPRQPTLFE